MSTSALGHRRGDRTCASAPRRGFTLIELLVVVAIIALLIAILLPSLARAREQAKLVACQSNVHQISLAFATYTADNKGRLPGMRADGAADWLGEGTNAPQKGTIFRKYMGESVKAYTCPSHSKRKTNYSYTANLLLAGASVEWLAGAHYPADSFARTSHTMRMKVFEGAPLIIEEHFPDPGGDGDELPYVQDSGWCNYDSITNRHLKMNGVGVGSLGFHDGHANRIRIAGGDSQGTWGGGSAAKMKYFHANAMCVRTKGGKYVSGLAWQGGSNYALMDSVKPAESYGIRHR